MGSGAHNPLAGGDLDRLLHDLRGPLTVIYGSVHLLQRRIHHGQVSDPHQLLDRLAAIERAAQCLDARLQRVEQDAAGR